MGHAVIASAKWLSLSGAAFRADQGKMGVADLRHYAARFCEWGGGPPLVLVPGLAGNFELLGPLARELARNYRVISFLPVTSTVGIVMHDKLFSV